MRTSLLRWRLAVPPEKGAWIWWIGPLVLGALAARRLEYDLVAVVLAGTAGFLIRQPLTILLRIVWRGRNPRDLWPAVLWAALYGLVITISAVWLLLGRHFWVIPLAAVATPVFGWYLWLVAQGQDRHQMTADIVAAATLALMAPAAFWSCNGASVEFGIGLWLISTLQASASIVHVMLRLEQRRWTEPGPWPLRLRRGMPALCHHWLNVVAGVVLVIMDFANGWLVVAFLLAAAEGTEAVLRPPVGTTPRRLGFRQLFVSIAFFLVAVAAVR
ncbi:MAG: YwiC-like family protein [Candidatus Hydrogenedentes bacterium]|nr:YwiC-like family protein [Candidatus Hydrogenedentota bacterium]